MWLTNQHIRKLSWITLFSIAMGFLEAAVVVYLRALYYPEGFDFPLVAIGEDIAITEFWREAATILMLLGIGVLTGRTAAQKFAYFLFSFAIWDIFYYVFLKALLDWPASLLTWDILFLIPAPWVGPVIAPVLISCLMILHALTIDYYAEKGVNATIKLIEWILLIVGSLIVILSFMWDYITYIQEGGAVSSVWTLSSNRPMFEEVAEYIPESYNWGLFALGTAVIVAGIGVYVRRMRKES